MPHKKTARDVEMQQYDASTKNRAPDFAGWDFTGSDLANADFYKADLSHMNFTGADLTSADFREADLTGANLGYADLTGANLTGANLAHADLSWSYYDPTQLLDTRGLHPGRGIHGIPRDTWDSLLPKDRDTHCIIQLLLDDWGGTLRDALATAHRITPADPDARRLLFTLLADWEGTIEEAAATAEELHKA